MFENVIKHNRVNIHKAVAVYETLSCEFCDGEMISTGLGITTNIKQWRHKCDSCGEEEWVEDHAYPRTAIRKIKEND
jgi:SH3-like domain-containing protein